VSEAHLVHETQGSARTVVPLDEFPESVRPIMAGALERAQRYLAEDFRGITTGGTVVPDLFPVRRTGVSLRPVVAAAERFIETLAPARRDGLLFPVDAKQWRSWHNMHPNLGLRHGVCLEDLDGAQRERALDILRATLSVAGLRNARDVMRLNEHVAELTGRSGEYGEWYYFISIFGTPSETEPWGWQFDGHHLIVNCFVLGDQLVLTPYFSGSEPVRAESGKFAGTAVLQAEETAGLRVMRALASEQRARATIGDRVPRDVLGTAQLDNLVLPYAGIPVSELTAAQRALVLETVAVYVDRMRPGHAELWMTEIHRHLNETHFGWIGPIDDGSPFYYRIHSPVIVIEFDHLPGVVWDNREPTRRHIHTVVRTPNGNDYGADLLRQHYAQHDHSQSAPHRRGLR
jgi:hypothetical protein